MTGYNCTLLGLLTIPTLVLLKVRIIFLSLGSIDLKLIGDFTVVFISMVVDSYLKGVAKASSVSMYMGLSC